MFRREGISMAKTRGRASGGLPPRKPANKVPGRIRYGGAKDSVVDQAIAKVGGKPIILCNMLSALSGKEISRQALNGWRTRKAFPRNMVVHVHKITGIPLVDLIKYDS